MLEKGNRANTLHGILLIALFSFAAFYIAEIPVVRRLSFSPLIVGIVLGMLYANSLRNRLPETWVPGIRFCTKQVLRWGIVLYGFRLTLAQVAAVGVPAVVVDLIVVTVTILGGVLLGRLLINGTIEYVDTFMLTMAMTALGTETSLDKFRQAGARPFVLAGLLYVWLVAGGYFVTKYVVGML